MDSLTTNLRPCLRLPIIVLVAHALSALTIILSPVELWVKVLALTSIVVSYFYVQSKLAPSIHLRMLKQRQDDAISSTVSDGKDFSGWVKIQEKFFGNILRESTPKIFELAFADGSSMTCRTQGEILLTPFMVCLSVKECQSERRKAKPIDIVILKSRCSETEYRRLCAAIKCGF